MESVVIGGGCFWCLDALFREVEGVSMVTCGYAGGESKNPTYKEVCEGMGGHAEVVHIEFDSSKISLEQILNIFFEIHDPTLYNRQGNDIGVQYRSIILYKDDYQKKAALDVIDSAQSRFENKIVTVLEPLKEFYEAEGYHQNYFALNPNNPYCAYVIAPKVKKFLKA